MDNKNYDNLIVRFASIKDFEFLKFNDNHIKEKQLLSCIIK